MDNRGNDADWYPGDQYVDIVGRDIYNKETADCVSEYTSIAGNYGNKIIQSFCLEVVEHSNPQR